jgi:4'-phosphopantetheinyl transferase
LNKIQTPYPLPDNGQIHLWIADMRQWLENKMALNGFLNEDEIQRLERYKILAKQEEFLCSRGLSRLILAGYLDDDPVNIQLGATPAGKPFLIDQAVYFNVSHSDETLLLAVGLFENIGVDIQRVYPISSLDKIANKIFSSNEKTKLFTMNGDTQLEYFFALWTAKEAYLKAQGEGFTRSPKNIEIMINPGSRKSYFVRDLNQPKGASDWTITALDLPEGYQGAVAVEGQLRQIQQIAFNPSLINQSKNLPKEPFTEYFHAR